MIIIQILVNFVVHNLLYQFLSPNVREWSVWSYSDCISDSSSLKSILYHNVSISNDNLSCAVWNNIFCQQHHQIYTSDANAVTICQVNAQLSLWKKEKRRHILNFGYTLSQVLHHVKVMLFVFKFICCAHYHSFAYNFDCCDFRT